MLSAVLKHAKKTNAVIMSAAVADYTSINPAKEKIKKKHGSDTLEIKLKTTSDILATLGRQKRKIVLVGFALETTDELTGAKEKLRKKNLDFIIMNCFGRRNRVFGSDVNRVTIIDRRGKVEQLPELPKFDVANKILDKIKSVL
jgi:phosphopantothenoylcysteine decarboxylase/phosphopantothenate--cysteine ligase